VSAELFEPTADQHGQQAAFLEVLRAELSGAGGRLPFDRFMELAL
jgi:hypothetical protein